jgi:hypothetical protein
MQCRYISRLINRTGTRLNHKFPHWNGLGQEVLMSKRSLLIAVGLFFLVCSPVRAEENATNKVLTMKYIGHVVIAPQDQGSLTISPDEKHIAYIHKSDKKSFVSYDSKEGKSYGKIIDGSLTFSPDSCHLAYIAEDRNEWFVVIDGKEGFHYDKPWSLEQCILRFESSDTVSYLILENKCLYEAREKIQ